jgi:hypothetical protein
MLSWGYYALRLGLQGQAGYGQVDRQPNLIFGPEDITFWMMLQYNYNLDTGLTHGCLRHCYVRHAGKISMMVYCCYSPAPSSS